MPRKRQTSKVHFIKHGCIVSYAPMSNGTLKWHVRKNGKHVPKRLHGEPFARKTFDSKSAAIRHARRIEEYLNLHGSFSAELDQVFSKIQLGECHALLKDLEKQIGRPCDIQFAVARFCEKEIERVENEKHPYIRHFVEEAVIKQSGDRPFGRSKSLGLPQLNDWLRTLELMDKWYGVAKPTELVEKEYFLDDFSRRLDAIISDTTKNPLSPNTKNKHLQRAKTFLDFVLKKCRITAPNPLDAATNYYSSLPSRPYVHENKIVQQLFNNAVENEAWQFLIPYLALVFFSSLRPEEIASQNHRIERLGYEKFKWDVPAEFCKGVYIDVLAEQEKVHWKTGETISSVKTSKLSIDRNGILAEPGIAWLKFYYEELHESGWIPATGDIEWRRKPWEALYKSVGLEKWPPSSARHTSASNAHSMWPESKDAILQAWGHGEATYRKHYHAKISPNDAVYFFNKIRPLTKGEHAVLAKKADRERAFEEARKNLSAVLKLDISEDVETVVNEDSGETFLVSNYLPDWYETEDHEIPF